MLNMHPTLVLLQQVLRSIDIFQLLGHASPNITHIVRFLKMFLYFLIVFIINIFELRIVLLADMTFQMRRHPNMCLKRVDIVVAGSAKVTVGMIEYQLP